MSRSLVGSSSTSRLAGRDSTRASISRARSPPESSRIGVLRLLRLEQEVLHVGDDVALLAIDDDVLAAAVGEEMRQRLVRVECGTLLVERGDLQIGAQPDRARIGLQARR